MGKPIGVLLKEAGIITEEMIVYALKVQKTTGERLGETLLRIGFVTDSEVASVLANQAGFPYTDLKGATPDTKILGQIPFNFAQKSNILPFDFVEGKLVVAVGDPFDSRMLSNMERFSRFPLSLQVAPEGELRRKIEQLYYLADHPIQTEVEQIGIDAQADRSFSAEHLSELLLSTAIENGSSDIHISPTSFATLVAYRIDGVLQLTYTLPQVCHSRLVASFKVISEMDIADQNRPQDGRTSFEFLGESYDLRVSTIPTPHGENLVIRVLVGGSGMIPVENLGFSQAQVEQVTRLTSAPYGMILATGPTGSGKSTTLYSILRKVNSMEKNVMTIEDPIEYQMSLVHQVAVNVKAGVTFSSAIKSFLRQDPDVILIGEIRDEETAVLASRAALTGHLVFSTLHTNDAPGAVARLRDLGLGDFMLSSTLSGVVAQRLIRKLCQFCKEEVSLSSLDKASFELQGEKHFSKVGCDRCRGTGYIGRMVVGEVLEIDDEIKVLIAEGGSPHEIAAAGMDKGMTNLRQSAVALVEAGRTDIAEFMRVVK